MSEQKEMKKMSDCSKEAVEALEARLIARQKEQREAVVRAIDNAAERGKSNPRELWAYVEGYNIGNLMGSVRREVEEAGWALKEDAGKVLIYPATDTHSTAVAEMSDKYWR